MSELQIAAERSWMIISTCIIVVLAAGAIAVLVWWIIKSAKDLKHEQNSQADYNNELLEHFCKTNAVAADAGWGNYIDMKDKYERLSEEYTDYKDRVSRWDANKTDRIKQLEKQLKDNDITPIPWEIPFGKEWTTV
jgi:hypothetical protein